MQSETDMKLGHVVRILTDIAALVEVPQHIERLQERQVMNGLYRTLQLSSMLLSWPALDCELCLQMLAC